MSRSHAPPALEISALVKCHAAGAAGCTALVRVLSGVDLAASCGETVAVVGAPGAGKTTLLLCAAGLLRPDAGSVRWFGRTNDGEPRVAYVGGAAPPASPLTVRELLATAGAPGRAGARAVERAFVRAALDVYADRPAREVPAPAGRRIALARALLGGPALLLVDDPLATCACGPPAAPSPEERVTGRCLAELARGGMAVVLAVREGVTPIAVAERRVLLRGGRVSVALARADGSHDAHDAHDAHAPRVRVAEATPAARAAPSAADASA